MKLYPKSEKSSLPYWFAHWVAFQKVAIKHHVWWPQYLLHDIEKPFLMWAWKDYPRVREFHRKHNNHHYQYDNGEIAPWLSCDYVAMAVDWECSHLTKEDKKLDAYGEFCRKLEDAYEEKNPVKIHILVNHLLPVLEWMGFAIDFENTEIGKKVMSGEWTNWDAAPFYEKMYGRKAPELNFNE